MKGIVGVGGFDWDTGNLGHCGIHGVTKAEIEELFRASPAVAPDMRHSAAEDRLLAVGRTAAGRALFVVFTLREKADKRLIRPICALVLLTGFWPAPWPMYMCRPLV